MDKFYYQVDIIKNPNIKNQEQRDELLNALTDRCNGFSLFVNYEERDKKYDGGSIFTSLWNAKYFKLVSLKEGLSSKAEIKKLKDLSAKISMFNNEEGPILSVNDLESLFKIDTENKFYPLN